MFILVNKYITLWRKVGLSKVFINKKKGINEKSFVACQA